MITLQLHDDDKIKKGSESILQTDCNTLKEADPGPSATTLQKLARKGNIFRIMDILAFQCTQRI
ncbi:hypothetical cytosolic protein [Syntrophus aciditrophicus SB]|uniref:Hypothetical cytosolic protein n=1 Tax=Syntrophus aciditrophicus (strain SB) TaxID=56780 RepID=Q2LPK3_SYNAS|nr:hypothetical cytosolic protein [Syntrophus aciditrophicus SB]